MRDEYEKNRMKKNMQAKAGVVSPTNGVTNGVKNGAPNGTVHEDYPTYENLVEDDWRPVGPWEAAYCYIDPTSANEILSMNHPDNRKLDMTRVRRYAKDMREGRWSATPLNAILRTDKDVMIDGQHTLQAILKSRETIPCLLYRNVHESLMEKLDQGKTRTGPGVAHMRGLNGGGGRIAIARAIETLDTGTLVRDMSQNEQADLLEKHYDLAEVAIKNHLGKSVISEAKAAIAWASQVHPGALELARQVREDDFHSGTPAHALMVYFNKERYQEEKNAGSVLVVMLKVLTAVDAHVNGRPLTNLRATTAHYEKIWRQIHGGGSPEGTSFYSQVEGKKTKEEIRRTRKSDI